MPFVLIPLIISLITTGAGIVNQIQENDRLNSEGQQAVTDQLRKGEAERANDYSQYVNTIDRLNEQQVQLAKQAQTGQAQRSRQLSIILFSTAVLMAGLTVYLAVQRKRA